MCHGPFMLLTKILYITSHLNPKSVMFCTKKQLSPSLRHPMSITHGESQLRRPNQRNQVSEVYHDVATAGIKLGLAETKVGCLSN